MFFLPHPYIVAPTGATDRMHAWQYNIMPWIVVYTWLCVHE